MNTVKHVETQLSPNEILRMSGKEQKNLFFQKKKGKLDRASKKPGQKLNINEGDWVRVALNPKNKGDVLKQKGPQQKWSGKSY